MLFFGNNNNKLRKEIETYFANAVETATSGAVIGVMQQMTRRMSGVRDVSGDEKKKVLEEIRNLQYSLDAAIASNSMNTIQMLCNQISERVTKLYGSPRKAPKKIGSPEELFTIMLANAQDELETLLAAQQDARSALMASPNNVLFQSQCDNYDLKINTIQGTLNYLRSQRGKEITVQSINRMSETQKMAAATASVTDQEFQILIEKHQQMTTEMGASIAATDDAMARFKAANSGMGSVASTATATAQATRTAAAQATSPAAQVHTPAAQTAKAPAQAVPAEAAKGTPQQELEKILGTIDVDAFIVTCRKHVAKLDKEIDYYDGYTKKFAGELKKLLEMRKTATPMECIRLDGKIESLKNEYETAKRALMRYSNEKTKAEQRLRVANMLKIEGSNSLNQLEEMIEGYGEFDKNLENIAMVIGDLVKQANEDVERISTAVDVMDSNEILISSSTSGIGATVEGIKKEDDKFASLESELGLL